MPAPVPVAEIVRSGFVEGHHYGSVVALETDGSVAWSVGDVDSAMLPRSCNKPVQALGMLRAGLDLDGELLALACASHSGEPFHIDGARRILESAGLDESALQTPPGYPLDEQAREEWIRSGQPRSSIAVARRVRVPGSSSPALALIDRRSCACEQAPRPSGHAGTEAATRL